MATITSGQMSYILDEVVSAVLINEFAELPNVFSTLYTIKTSARARERQTSISGLSQFDEKVEASAAAEEQPIQQFQKTFNHTPFAKTVKVSRELVDDEEWGWFENLAVQLANAANRTMESQAAAPFGDAFTGASYVGEDGLSLCNNAHVNVDGGNSQDNNFALALSAANVSTVRVAHRKFTDYKGEKVHINPNGLLVPLDLEQTAWEIVNSNLKPGSANNDANFYQGMFQLYVWNWLTDTNAWFTLDTMLMRMHLLWYMRSGLETYGDGDLFAGVRRIGAYFRKSHGFVDWRWCAGSNPS